MAHSTQFAIGMHILVLAAVDNDTPLTSERAGKSAGTNAAFIRKTSSKLSKAGLLKVSKGKYGGMALGRPAHQITLWDVYVAVDNSDLFSLHASVPSEKCFVGRTIMPTLTGALHGVSQAFRDSMETTTLADVSAQLLSRAGREDKLAGLS